MDREVRLVAVEDFIEYRLFLVHDEQSDAEKQREILQTYLEQILAMFAPLLAEYIWQNQPFHLKYKAKKGAIPAHIGGKTHFGDNVEDEWFIVYLIKQITKEFPDLAARVEDNDGDFLLIEAADFLPKWLKPENSANRVLFYRGKLHIIPLLHNVHPDPSSNLEISQVLKLLSAHPDGFLAKESIAKAVEKRIEGYPGRMKESLHRARCFVPSGIAVVLKERPQVLSAAVQAFYLRDPLDLKACRTFHHFLPETRVLTSVLFTKCLYAQLIQQKFQPDKRSGYTLPPFSHSQYKAYELGMKLAHGFEILCSKFAASSAKDIKQPLKSPLWTGFLNALEKNGFFKGEMEGSARYCDLLRKAENYFQQSVFKPDSSKSLSAGEEVLRLISTLPINMDKLKQEEANLPPDEDDSWLDISPEKLEKILQDAAGSKETVLPQSSDTDQNYNLSEVTDSMKAFISKVSSHEGAEVPWFPSEAPVTFDFDSFTRALETILGPSPEELDSDDLESEEDFAMMNSDENLRGNEQPLLDGETLGSLRSYMDIMDRELSRTNIGKSFAKKKTEHAAAHTGPEKVEDSSSKEESGPEEQVLSSIDVDLNLVTNILESYSSQSGLAGPASNLLQSMGVHLPDNTDQEESDLTIKH